MGPMASSTDAYKRGGHRLPGRPAELPKGGVPDTFITHSGIHRRGMQSVRIVGLGFHRENNVKAAAGSVATAKMNRESNQIRGFKVLCNHRERTRG